MFVVSAKLGHTPSFTSCGCASVVEMWQVITLQEGPLHVYGLLVCAQEKHPLAMPCSAVEETWE